MRRPGRPDHGRSFLAAFRNRYPAYGEALWATAKNCGYEIDITAPPAVTGLYSTSHATSGDSPDATIDLVWTRAVDDVSGVEGYGITIAGGIGLPTADLDIGDVTSYTTPSLAPGTYYFSIRTLDRSGKWSGTYAWAGPYTVRSPLAANLTFDQCPGWAAPLVPRPTTDATFGNVPGPATLTGDAAGDLVQHRAVEQRRVDHRRPSTNYAYVDGAWQLFGWAAPLAPTTATTAINAGLPCIRGGRHTFEARLDATELVAETNETDNRWAHQWVWTPTTLTPDVPMVRAAPPGRPPAGTPSVDGSPLYANVDGVRMSGASWWDVAVLRPLSPLNDRDLALFAASAGAANGFATPLAGSYSARAHRRRDRQPQRIGWGTPFDVGVVN